MHKYLLVFVICFISILAKAQNNYIVKTEDGRRVLLKADYTWEYIDLTEPKAVNNTSKESKNITEQITNQPKLTKAATCQLNSNFKEPKLNTQVQAFLKRSRSSIKQLKKKVAKKENCSIADIKLISTTETKAKGTYNFCTCNGKVTYKRNGASFFKKGKLF